MAAIDSFCGHRHQSPFYRPYHCALEPRLMQSRQAVQTDAVQTDRGVSAAQTDAVQTNAVRTDAVQTDCTCIPTDSGEAIIRLITW